MRQEDVIYPYNEWKIIENEFNVENNYINEAIFALGNGYIGMRGNFEEEYQEPQGTSLEGTYLNGFYETGSIYYGEELYGYAKESQTMLNVTNSKIIKLYLGDEEFDLFSGRIIDYKRVLDMKQGILIREVIWEAPSGKQIKLKIKRIISFTNKHLAVIDYKVIPLNFTGQITLVSAVDGNVTNQQTDDDPRVGSHFGGKALHLIDKKQEGDFAVLLQKTVNTDFKLASGMKNQLLTNNRFDLETLQLSERIESRYTIDVQKKEEIELIKYISYYTSKDYPEDEILSLLEDNLKQAEEIGFKELLLQQQKYLTDFWQGADIIIEGDEALQQGIRFNQFHLLQSVGRDGKTSIAAKGLTGEGYEGHYFWDSETYVLPFFLYNQPEISKGLLEYRYYTLNGARERARIMGHKKGALYPWRTISGNEASAYYPAGTAQYHINADISYALKSYMEATEDVDFFLEYGAEILFETARLWIDLGDYIISKEGQFCINQVTGPDEYTTVVNNNCYTNYMAQMHLNYAFKMVEKMRKDHYDRYCKLADKINLTDDEVKEWKKAADNMYLPYDKEMGIHPQDDSFLDKEIWDFASTPDDNYPLLLHYHPLVINRYQVCKQADVVLALFLLGDQFDFDDKKRNFDYYEKITTHDSSLSSCIHSIIASELGYYDKAYDYFMNTARMDLDNYHNNSQYGVHTACMAGAWMALVNGFAGMRVYDGELKFAPYLPKEWKGYRFKVKFKGCQLQIGVNNNDVIYKLIEGESLNFYHQHEMINLKAGEEKSIEL